MLKYIVYFLLALSLLTGLVLAYGAIKDKERSEMPTSPQGEEEVEGEVIKVVPQDFPINELSDSWFGKDVENETTILPNTSGNTLSESAGKVPAWLDQIISRESIVAFNKHVLAKHPDELQFSQSAEKSYSATEGWNAFLVEFETSPTGYMIAVMGAYKSESESYWMSDVMPEKTDLVLDGLMGMADGAQLWGKKNGAAFRATVKKETAKMAVSAQ